MELIRIKQKEERGDSWVFEVEIESDDESVTRHSVIVPKEYWRELTDGTHEPEGLVKKSFEFLLSREPKEAILSEFELPVIEKYFPEYKSTISSLL